MQLYTAGYQNKNVFKAILSFEGVLVDIRQNPRVKNPQWSQITLSHLFGERYYHCKELGNKVYWTDKIEIVNLQKGMSQVVSLLEVADVLLLCCCVNLSTCHRKVIADEIERQYGIKAIHLG